MSERELTKEEMGQELANVKGKPSVPSDGVVFDKARLDIMAKRAARRGNKPNNKRSKVPEQRDFMSEEEREEFIKKYGPYAAALQTDDERRYFIERRDEIFGSDEFNLDMILDTNIVLMVIMDEIILQRLFSELAKTPQSKSINANYRCAKALQREHEDSLMPLESRGMLLTEWRETTFIHLRRWRRDLRGQQGKEKRNFLSTNERKKNSRKNSSQSTSRAKLLRRRRL